MTNQELLLGLHLNQLLLDVGQTLSDDFKKACKAWGDSIIERDRIEAEKAKQDEEQLG